jgi:carboxypeptidase family protein
VALAGLVVLALGALAAPAAMGAVTGISGHVTQLSGGSAVVDAEVCAEEQGGEFEFECTLTKVGGSYEILGLEPGQYVVSFYAGESGLNLAPQYYNGFDFWRQAARVTVAAEAVTPGIDAALLAGGTISGRVTAAATGQPLAGVEVCSFLEEEEFDGCAYTASNGTYNLTGQRAGQHEVGFWAQELGYETRFSPPVSVSAGGTTPNVNAALVLAGRIGGHVYTAANHQPLAGISVCAVWSPTGETAGCAKTNSSGAYAFFPVPAGAWKIAFSPEPGEVEFFEGVQPDSWPTQFWNSKPTLALAEAISVTPASVFNNIDGLLGPGPAPPASTSPSSPLSHTSPTALAPKPLHCGKGKVKKRVKGTLRCLKRHEHRRHQRHRRHH